MQSNETRCDRIRIQAQKCVMYDTKAFDILSLCVCVLTQVL